MIGGIGRSSQCQDSGARVPRQDLMRCGSNGLRLEQPPQNDLAKNYYNTFCHLRSGHLQRRLIFLGVEDVSAFPEPTRTANSACSAIARAIARWRCAAPARPRCVLSLDYRWLVDWPLVQSHVISFHLRHFLSPLAIVPFTFWSISRFSLCTLKPHWPMTFCFCYTNVGLNVRYLYVSRALCPSYTIPRRIWSTSHAISTTARC